MKTKSFEERSFLTDSIRRTIKLVLREKDLDRKYLLYNRKGHKKIGIKTRLNSKITR